MSSELTGLIAAVHTPLHADGRLHLELVPAIVRQLADDTVDGFFVCGSTGEFPSLTDNERKGVARAYKEAVGDLPVIVHVGHTSLRAAQELAEHVQSVGADAIAATAPFYFKPATTGALVR